MQKLKNSSVAVFGIGGVGSFASEALARAGVGRLALFDSDIVCGSNINRQLIATMKTIGRFKTEVMKERILEINPEAAVSSNVIFYSADTAPGVDLSGFDYIADAIDTVSSKLLLIERAAAAGVPIISSMGAGNKLCGRFEVADIYATSVCPLARVMRRELAKRGVKSLKAVYSKEPPVKPPRDGDKRKQTPGSISFVPSAAGLMLAGEIIRDLLGISRD